MLIVITYIYISYDKIFGKKSIKRVSNVFCHKKFQGYTIRERLGTPVLDYRSLYFDAWPTTYDACDVLNPVRLSKAVPTT